MSKHRDEIAAGEEDYSETINPEYCVECDEESDNVEYDDPYVCKYCIKRKRNEQARKRSQ